jgi:DNA helicase-2/ATP-dependent DNA helicase PcrA
MKNTAKEILTRFVLTHLDDIYRIKEVEARLEFPLEKATIAGRVDVIIRQNKDKESIEVRDYKTSDAVTTYEESSLQLQVYSLGLKKINQPVEVASIAYLEQEKEGGNDIDYVSVSDNDLQKASELAKSCINGIKNSFFRAKPGEQCKTSCDYEKICKRSNVR